jgi:hypothetical protein
MGYTLYNPSAGSERVPARLWELALPLARHYGWKPTGTAQPDDWDGKADGRWTGTYEGNDGQWVVEQDAAALAETLERAASAPDFAEQAQREMDEMNADIDAYVAKVYPPAPGEEAPQHPPLTPEEIGRLRDRLLALAVFVRQGEFSIE